MVETATVRGPVGFMAFHAGLEAGTAEMAAAAAEHSGASVYLVEQPADLRWHVPSVEVDPATSPVLADWLARIRRVVALHGYGRPGRDLDVLVGGADPTLCADVAGHLAALVPGLRFVHGRDVPAGLGGRHRRNPVNLAPDGGVQLELPVLARRGDLAAGLTDALADLGRHWEAELGRRQVTALDPDPPA